MAKMVCLTEEAFDEIFSRIEFDFTYAHGFMKPHETPHEFKKTKRNELLIKVRSSIAQLKNDLLRG